jgi:hypothetical protein
MDDLFRFVLLRPANLPDSGEVKVLDAPSIDSGMSRAAARREAVQLLTSGEMVRRTEELGDAATALAVHDALAGGPQPAETVRELVRQVSGSDVADLVASDGFVRDEGRLADVLVATKLVSDSAGADARGLAAAAQGYDAIRALADGADPVGLRPLAMPAFRSGDQKDAGFPDRRLSGDLPEAGQGDEEGSRGDVAAEEDMIARLDRALTELGRIRSGDFFVPEKGEVQQGPEERPAPQGGTAPREHPGDARVAERPTPLSARLETPWQLSAEALRQVSPEVRETVAGLNLDLTTDALPYVVHRLHDARTEALTARDLKVAVPAQDIVKVGGTFLGVAPSSDYVGTPAAPMPTGHGSIRQVGIGDLLMVRQHVLRHEGGEVAHVENVLKSEHLSRDTRRLERTETTVLTEAETTKEDERDTQTTDRFSLKRETSNTLKQDTESRRACRSTPSTARSSR